MVFLPLARIIGVAVITQCGFILKFCKCSAEREIPLRRKSNIKRAGKNVICGIFELVKTVAVETT